MINFYPGLMLVWHQPSPKSPDILVHTRATKAALRPSSRRPAPRQSRSPMYTVPPRASRTAGQVAPMPSPHQTLREPFLLVVVVVVVVVVGTQHHNAVGTDSAQSIFAPARLQLHLQHETRAHFPHWHEREQRRTCPRRHLRSSLWRAKMRADEGRIPRLEQRALILLHRRGRGPRLGAGAGSGPRASLVGDACVCSLSSSSSPSPGVTQT